jgi:AcrR family transcriptional regulator
MLLDAGLVVMRRNGYQDASVAEILQEAGVSVRAFYRHFATKDALLLALFYRDTDAVGEGLCRAVDQSSSPEAVTAWLDGYLDVFYEPRRAARMAVLASPAARRAEGYEEALAYSQRVLTAPLADVLRKGNREKSLHSPRPEHDAETMLAVASSVCHPVSAHHFTARDDARQHVQRFCWPAFGLSEPRGRRRGSARPPGRR